MPLILAMLQLIMELTSQLKFHLMKIPIPSQLNYPPQSGLALK